MTISILDIYGLTDTNSVGLKGSGALSQVI